VTVKVTTEFVSGAGCVLCEVYKTVTKRTSGTKKTYATKELEMAVNGGITIGEANELSMSY